MKIICDSNMVESPCEIADCMNQYLVLFDVADVTGFEHHSGGDIIFVLEGVAGGEVEKLANIMESIIDRYLRNM